MLVDRLFNSFIFTHIPKCGGTSFRAYLGTSALNSGIPEKQIHIPGFHPKDPNTNINELDEHSLVALQSSTIKVLADHSYFNVHLTKRLKTEKPFYYTILREPVDRFISHYNFFYYKNGYDNLKGVSLNDLPEDKLLKILNKDVNNIITSYLSNKKDKDTGVNQEDFLRALYNLERHVACFGILEEMPKSLEILNQYKPNWMRFDEGFPTKNANKQNTKQLQPNAHVEKIIIKANLYDVKLYDYAKQLFKLRYDAYCNFNK